MLLMFHLLNVSIILLPMDSKYLESVSSKETFKIAIFKQAVCFEMPITERLRNDMRDNSVKLTVMIRPSLHIWEMFYIQLN